MDERRRKTREDDAMRLISVVFVIALSLDAPAQEWHTKWDSAGNTWGEKWTNTLDSLPSFPPNERIEILGAAARIGLDVSNSERNGIFKRAQSLLLAIPGHAEYFGRRIHEANEPLKGPEYGKFVHEARNERMYGFQTLSNLPSPETVKVLGEMLSDTWRKEFSPPPGRVDVAPPPNSLALDAIDNCLRSLPLRDPPSVPRLMAWDDPEDVLVHPWQSWWKEIKSGKRTFSFKGQAVEYRFKPDGTWEALAMANPPDDGLEPEPSKPEAVRHEKSPSPSAPPSSAPTASRFIYGWIIGCGIILLAVLAVFLKRRHAS
jgi:hypothetical protein